MSSSTEIPKLILITLKNTSQPTQHIVAYTSSTDVLEIDSVPKIHYKSGNTYPKSDTHIAKCFTKSSSYPLLSF